MAKPEEPKNRSSLASLADERNANLWCQVNAHPLDDEIEFFEEGHIYKIKDLPPELQDKRVSVTSLIDLFFKEFDADEVITKMMDSRNWPKSKYFGMTREEIKDGWDRNRDESAALGTELHSNIEVYMNGLLSSDQYPPTPEFGYFLQFWSDFQTNHPEWKPHRTEWVIFDREGVIPGSIDMVFINPDGELWLVDWKRSKEIKLDSTGGGKYRPKYGFRPFHHIEDCNYNHYCIQLNIYRRILEKNYGFRVVKMDIVVMHPNNESYLQYSVPNMDPEIDNLWEVRMSELYS